MIDLSFNLNGVDFSDCVYHRGYKTDRQPVYAKQFVDLSMVSHDTIARYKDFLEVTLNPLTEERTQQLSAALLVSPLYVTFWSAQRGENVTESMRITQIPAALALKSGAIRYYNVGPSLAFEQL